MLYLNRSYFDTVDEALGALHAVTAPCVPWIGAPTRITRPVGWVLGDEDWTVNSEANHNLLLAGIEDYLGADNDVLIF